MRGGITCESCGVFTRRVHAVTLRVSEVITDHDESTSIPFKEMRNKLLCGRCSDDLKELVGEVLERFDKAGG